MSNTTRIRTDAEEQAAYVAQVEGWLIPARAAALAARRIVVRSAEALQAAEEMATDCESKVANYEQELESARAHLVRYVNNDLLVDLVPCAECGHEHYAPAFKVYIECPLDGAGCACKGQQ